MKSKLAKIIDYTLGSLLIFGAATAVAVYFLPLNLAAFCALSVTATAIVLSRLIGNKQSSEAKLSKAADDMFFEFMFLSPDAPSKYLFNGLKKRDERVKLHGSGVYLNKTAAYPVLFDTVDDKLIARLISRAKHYGCDKIVVISKAPPSFSLSVSDYSVKSVFGNDAYRLYASLEALPEIKYSVKNKRHFWDGYRGALSRDKIIRYATLSAAFFAITAIFRFSPITLACAIICAALFIASSILAIVNAARKKSR